MAIESIGVFSIRPDWLTGITETLDWLTSVTESAAAFEQRMGLRLSPRQKFEIAYTVVGPTRTHFDLLSTASAGSPIYLPVWQDIGKLTAPVSIGGTALSLDTRYTEFQNCRFAILIIDEYDFEVVEIDSFTDSSISLAGGVANNWPTGARIHPVKKCRVETQATGERLGDRAYRGRIRFTSLEANRSNAGSTLGGFLGNYVLEEEPNDAETETYQYERKMFTIDRSYGLQQISDVAGFLNHDYSWFAKGRFAHSRLRGLFYALQGRRVPIWIPSYFSDFELAESAAAADTTLTVKRCGYTDTGGPFKNREYILIHLRDGTRIYRRITGSIIVGSTEILSLDTAPGTDIDSDSVKRISFLTFCRLDQDTIEFTHHADTHGLTTVRSVFRNATEIAPPIIPPLNETPPEYDDRNIHGRTNPFWTVPPTSVSLTFPAEGLGAPSPGDLIIVLVANQKWADGTVRIVDSIDTTSGLPFVFRGRHNFVDASHAGTRYNLEIWTAISAGALVDEHITATFDGPVGQAVIEAIPIKGALNAAPLDDGTDPILFDDSDTAGVGPSITFSTSNPYDIVFNIFVGNGISTNTITPVGWVPAFSPWWSVALHDTGVLKINGAYKRVSTAQSGVTISGTDPGIQMLFAIRN